MAKQIGGMERSGDWAKIFGIEWFKVDYTVKRYLYKIFGLTMPKMKEQSEYWTRRGNTYCNEILHSGFLDREVFFQNMIMERIERLDVNSAFEAGCGFGWNIRRVKELYPHMTVGGLDFSATQLENGKEYMKGYDIETVQGDCSAMPLPDNAFDLGFSLGVFMNIHPDKIDAAAREMMRVCKRYVLHLEYDENHATQDLRDRRAIKTNIISHNYKAIYESLGARAVEVLTHEDFGDAFREHVAVSAGEVKDRWEKIEGPDKYVLYLFEIL
jgi:SAM-dependent methyltransferase